MRANLTHTPRRFSLLALLLVLSSLLAISQAVADDTVLDSEELKEGDTTILAASHPYLRGGAVYSMQAMSQPAVITSRSTAFEPFMTMPVGIGAGKNQFLVVEFTSDVRCVTDPGTIGTCSVNVRVNGTANGFSSSNLSVSQPGTAIAAPVTVRRQTICLGPGGHTVEVFVHVSKPTMQMTLSSSMLTTYRSATCIPT
jgi:hypothetical protein